MLEIKVEDNGNIALSGRLDASQSAKANAIFDEITEPQVVDMKGLDYISSLGLGILLKTQKRINERSGGGLKLVNVSPHLNDIFRYSGFSQIFDIEPISS